MQRKTAETGGLIRVFLRYFRPHKKLFYLDRIPFYIYFYY